jgi:hypothetical protein
MTALYMILFRLLQWHALQVDRSLFWLWLRLTDDGEPCELEDEPPPRENVVHLPRRELH